MEQPPAHVAIAPANPEPPTRTARKSLTIPEVVKSVGAVLAVFIVGAILANVGAAIIGLLMKWTTPDTSPGALSGDPDVCDLAASRHVAGRPLCHDRILERQSWV
ncbi:MAG: hypothetical protein JWM91_287 [Rhodospirillales bacterium]|nr:hypothetical protein [Rhodospirillales bacterium]